MDRWDELRFLLAVSRHGTLAAAGRALRVNATTVGRQIEALERRLGTKLFTRLPSDHGRIVQVLPVASAVIITALGLILTARSLPGVM